MKKVQLIALGGGSGSGKTTIVNRLREAFPDSSFFTYDAYYKSFPELSLEERAKLNFDDPSILDEELFLRDLSAIKKGKAIDIPVYDFASHLRKEGVSQHVEPAPIVFVDGVLIYTIPEPKRYFDYLIYVHCDADIRLARRILRDSEERGRTPRSVISQYLATVRPMHYKYVEKGREIADYIYDNTDNNGLKEEEIAKLISSIKQSLNQ